MVETYQIPVCDRLEGALRAPKVSSVPAFFNNSSIRTVPPSNNATATYINHIPGLSNLSHANGHQCYLAEMKWLRPPCRCSWTKRLILGQMERDTYPGNPFSMAEARCPIGRNKSSRFIRPADRDPVKWISQGCSDARAATVEKKKWARDS